uniref:PiggyBac transposable element-derived protein domain-containing protein n=1 Tax=Clastoptera arizonana TaxID=38151 RepID=A0A1B6EAR4_9HEMI
MLPKEVFEKIVDYTNVKIRSIQAKYSRDRDARETDFAEMTAYIGILFLLGECRANKSNSLDVWRKNGLGIEIFRLIMGVNRLKFLQQNIRFEDTSDPNRAQRKETDKLYCVRDLFETFVNYCITNYSHC